MKWDIKTKMGILNNRIKDPNNKRCQEKTPPPCPEKREYDRLNVIYSKHKPLFDTLIKTENLIKERKLWNNVYIIGYEFFSIVDIVPLVKLMKYELKYVKTAKGVYVLTKEGKLTVIGKAVEGLISELGDSMRLTPEYAYARAGGPSHLASVSKLESKAKNNLFMEEGKYIPGAGKTLRPIFHFNDIVRDLGLENQLPTLNRLVSESKDSVGLSKKLETLRTAFKTRNERLYQDTLTSLEKNINSANMKSAVKSALIEDIQLLKNTYYTAPRLASIRNLAELIIEGRTLKIEGYIKGKGTGRGTTLFIVEADNAILEKYGIHIPQGSKTLWLGFKSNARRVVVKDIDQLKKVLKFNGIEIHLAEGNKFTLSNIETMYSTSSGGVKGKIMYEFSPSIFHESTEAVTNYIKFVRKIE